MVRFPRGAGARGGGKSSTERLRGAENGRILYAEMSQEA